MDDVRRVGAAREDEPKIAACLRQRFQQLIDLRRDVYFLYAGDCRCLLDPVDAFHRSLQWDRNHHHAGCRRFTDDGRDITPHSMTKQNVFEAGRFQSVDAVEAKHFGTETTDRTRRNFQDVNRIGGDAALSMNGAVPKTDRRRGASNLTDDRRLCGPIER